MDQLPYFLGYASNDWGPPSFLRRLQCHPNVTPLASCSADSAIKDERPNFQRIGVAA